MRDYVRRMTSVLLILVTLLCSGCTVPRTIESLNEEFLDKLAAYAVEKPMTIALPEDGSERLLFWNIERNFVFSDIYEVKGHYAVYSSGDEEDNQWLTEQILPSDRQFDILEVSDPILEHHTETASEFAASAAYKTMKGAAEQGNVQILVTWSGIIMIRTAAPNEFVRIAAMEEHDDGSLAITVNQAEEEQITLLENTVFPGIDLDVLMNDQAKQEDAEQEQFPASMTQKPQASKLGLQIDSRFLQDGILFYKITSKLSYQFALDEIILTRKEGDTWAEADRNPYVPQLKELKYIQPGGYLYGVICLDDYAYMEPGEYKLVFDTTAAEEAGDVLTYTFTME